MCAREAARELESRFFENIGARPSVKWNNAEIEQRHDDDDDDAASCSETSDSTALIYTYIHSSRAEIIVV